MSNIPPEQAAMAPFLHGWLAQELITEGHKPDRIMKITDVQIPTNRAGDYEPYMIVHFESGAAVKVSFEPVDANALEVNEAIRSIKGE